MNTFAFGDSLGVAWIVAPELVAEIQNAQTVEYRHSSVAVSRMMTASKAIGAIRATIDRAAQHLHPNMEVYFRIQSGMLEVRPYDRDAQIAPDEARLKWTPTGLSVEKLRSASGSR